jgi:protein-arginine kinase activator protein McsA
MDNNCNNCGNTELTFVLATIANGQKRVRKQCLKCGASDSKVYKHSLFKNYLELPLFQPELRAKFIQDKADQRYLRRDIGAKHYYNDVYLKSPEWKAKRENTLKRDNYTCVCCEEKATQVHHINYNHVYQEKEKELISVCKSCHEGIHSDMVVYFGAFRADFGRLGLCQHCDEYHQNGNDSLCNACKK